MANPPPVGIRRMKTITKCCFSLKTKVQRGQRLGRKGEINRGRRGERGRAGAPRAPRRLTPRGAGSRQRVR
eukprot:9344884-Pyramimonas_sp.AAC.1